MSGTLRDATTGLPLPSASGTVQVYAGGRFVEQQPFTTDSAGTYTLRFAEGISSSVQVRFAVKGYPHQFYDGAAQIADATPVALRLGDNVLDVGLRSTRLVGTLRDDALGTPIPAAVGRINVFKGNDLVDTATFTSDACGVYTATLGSLLTGSVRLQFDVGGYPIQFYDRAPSANQAAAVDVKVGTTVVNPRLLAVRLVNRLLDDVTGQPIPQARGVATLYNHNGPLEQLPFIADSHGVYTATLRALSYPSARLEYRVDGYPRQFYDRRAQAEQADSIALAVGLNALTTHLVPTFTLVNTLNDNLSGRPLANVNGVVTAYNGVTPLQVWRTSTDASGVYTVTFTSIVTGPIKLLYEIEDYPRQFYAGRLTLADANLVTLSPGRTDLQTRLLPFPSIVHTLIDDATGKPLAYTSGWVRADWDGGALFGFRQFTTDASGVYTATFTYGPLGKPATLLVEGVNGYYDQYHDTLSGGGKPTPVVLNSGYTYITTHMGPLTFLVNRLVDGETGEPLRNTPVQMAVTTQEANWGIYYTTDDNGVITYPLGPLPGSNYVVYYQIDGYPAQYYGGPNKNGTSAIGRAQRITVGYGRNEVETRLSRFPTLTSTLIDDATGEPVRHAFVQIQVYTGPPPGLFVRGYTDAAGQFSPDFNGFLAAVEDEIQVEYSVAGYPVQFFNGRPTRDEADPVLVKGGANTLTVRLVRSFPTTSTPTASPTAPATEVPTASPTASATEVPSPTPTASPTPIATQAPSATPTATVPVSGSSVTPEQGGVLIVASDALTVTAVFPPGAVREPVVARIRWLAGTSGLGGSVFIDTPFVIEAATISGASITQLSRPLTLTVEYAGAQLSESDQRRLVLGMQDGVSGRWLPLKAQIDPVGRRLSLALDHLSPLAVYVEAQTVVYLPWVVADKADGLP